MTTSNPLAPFQKIGHNTLLHTPTTYTPPASPLILLFTWNAAAAKHIAKYTLHYQQLFPTAQILLVRSFTADVFNRSTAHLRNGPALDVVREHVKNGGEVLVHSFSNGGGMQLVEFARAWEKREGEKVPMRAQIIDSAPGRGDWARSHKAIVAGLPRSWIWGLIGGLLVHILLAVVWVSNAVRGKENDMVVMYREMNDTELFNVRVPRVYLYSRADEMVGWEEVEEHADEAEARGWQVKRVKFESSSHVGHVREDGEKYWGAVMEAWRQGPRP